MRVGNLVILGDAAANAGDDPCSCDRRTQHIVSGSGIYSLVTNSSRNNACGNRLINSLKEQSIGAFTGEISMKDFLPGRKKPITRSCGQLFHIQRTGRAPVVHRLFAAQGHGQDRDSGFLLAQAPRPRPFRFQPEPPMLALHDLMYARTRRGYNREAHAGIALPIHHPRNSS